MEVLIITALTASINFIKYFSSDYDHRDLSYLSRIDHETEIKN